MATPRSQLVDNQQALHYHLISKCVRGNFLCGYDSKTGRNYDHRKLWLEERLLFLAQFFAVELDGYCIMDNHFHLVMLYDPLASARWNDEEVAERWYEAYPPTVNGMVDEDLKRKRIQALTCFENGLISARRHLGSLSMFMKALKQPIAVRANREDDCKGHFFEQRFYSGAILSEGALLASMAYVDLNPVRAKIAESIEECLYTGVAKRLQGCENQTERLEEVLRPIVSGIDSKKEPRRKKTILAISLSEYVEKLEDVIQSEIPNKRTTWWDQVASIRRRQKAYGTHDQLTSWANKRGQQWLQASPLPSSV